MSNRDYFQRRKHCIRWSARKRKLEFKLQTADVRDLHAMFDACPSCGYKFILDPCSKHYPTFDRIDADRGYVRDNLQLLCDKCNREKSRSYRAYNPIGRWHPAAQDLHLYPRLVEDL